MIKFIFRIFSLMFFLVLSFIIVSCTKNYGTINGAFTTEVIDTDVYSRYLSLDLSGDVESVYYSDEITLSLKKSIKSNGEWVNKYIDRVDVTERINPIMGKHFVSNKNGKESVYYLDFQSEKKSVFKKLSKENTDSEYLLGNIDIDCVDFSFVDGMDKILFYKNDDLHAIELLNNDDIAKIDFELDDYQDIKEFTLTSTLDYITIVYKDNSDILYMARLSLLDGKIVTDSKSIISDSVSLFDTIFINGDVGIIYYTFDSMINYYESGVVTKVGYYPYCSKVHVGFTGKNIFFIASNVEDSKENTDIYGLNIVYKLKGKKSKWAEEKIIESEIPFSAIESLVNNDKLYILSSGSNLILNSISLKQFE